MSLEEKIEKLAAKQKSIQQEIETLQKQRHTEIADALEKLDLKNMDTFTLVGGILHLLNAKHTDHVLEEWRKAGRRFCKTRKSFNAKSVKAPLEKKAA